MKTTTLRSVMLAMIVFALIRCNEEQSLSGSQVNEETTRLIDVAQTSGQLASGTSFNISGSSTAGQQRPQAGPGHKPSGRVLDGLHLLAPTDELLAIVDAETASDFRGMRISKNGGASITHYNADGGIVTLPPPPAQSGPHGCSFSGQQFPELDALLATIVKTEIDFDTGVAVTRGEISITRSGKIIITRTSDGSARTEVTSFENYKVNGAAIEGTKTRVSTFDATTGSGTSTTSVAHGKITFADGTVAAWTSDKKRSSNITRNADGRPVSGTIVTEVNTAVTATDGTIIYSHKTTVPLQENIGCPGRRHGPVSGALETIYRDDTVAVNFGNGSCESRTVTITLNGIITTKTIGG